MSLDVKDVVATAIKGGTDAVVLCHNHPNGVALPSMEDMDATGSIARALGLVNVHLLDHFILTDTGVFFHAGRQPPAHLRFQDRHAVLAVKQKTCLHYKTTVL